jgi:hypothetical protein
MKMGELFIREREDFPMKITQSQLTRLIKEETNQVLKEQKLILERKNFRRFLTQPLTEAQADRLLNELYATDEGITDAGPTGAGGDEIALFKGGLKGDNLMTDFKKLFTDKGVGRTLIFIGEGIIWLAELFPNLVQQSTPEEEVGLGTKFTRLISRFNPVWPTFVIVGKMLIKMGEHLGGLSDEELAKIEKVIAGA